jgi:hypothetical protein
MSRSYKRPANSAQTISFLMRRTETLAALIQAYRDEVKSLTEQAALTAPEDAASLLHRAENLQSFVDAYDRLESKAVPGPARTTSDAST